MDREELSVGVDVRHRIQIEDLRALAGAPFGHPQPAQPPAEEVGARAGGKERLPGAGAKAARDVVESRLTPVLIRDRVLENAAGAGLLVAREEGPLELGLGVLRAAQVLAFERLRRLVAQSGVDRRHDVDRLGVAIVDLPGTLLRVLDEEGDADDLVGRLEAQVAARPGGPERAAVIRSDHDHRLVEDAGALERVHQPADEGVDKAHGQKVPLVPLRRLPLAAGPGLMNEPVRVGQVRRKTLAAGQPDPRAVREHDVGVVHGRRASALLDGVQEPVEELSRPLAALLHRAGRFVRGRRGRSAPEVAPLIVERRESAAPAGGSDEAHEDGRRIAQHPHQPLAARDEPALRRAAELVGAEVRHRLPDVEVERLAELRKRFRL